MKLPCALVVVLLLAPPLSAQQKKQARAAQTQAFHDDLGLTCTQILAMPSSEYIAKIVATDDSRVDGQLRGIRNFGRCYDERTARLAVSLSRRGIGPKKSALANLADLEQKLDAFTNTALSDAAQLTTPAIPAAPPMPLKKAYAELYEKQFRYAFYESYEPQSAKPKIQPRPLPTHAAAATRADGTATTPDQSAAAAATPNPAAKPKPAVPPAEDLPTAPVRSVDLGPAHPPKTASPAPSASSSTPAAPPPSEENASASADAKANVPATLPAEIDPFTKAKNHFGELLGLLPPEQIHEVHSAFGKLFNGNPVSEDMKVDIYKYAIFLLESPKDQPFAAPPF